jgi:hypothetical protein
MMMVIKLFTLTTVTTAMMMMMMTKIPDVVPQLQVHDVTCGELLGCAAAQSGDRHRVWGKLPIGVYRPGEGGGPLLACLQSNPPAVMVIDPVTVTVMHRVPFGGTGGDGAALTQMCMFESLNGRTCLAIGDRLGDVHVVDLGEAPVRVGAMPAANKKG